jgi:hypothetical protein
MTNLATVVRATQASARALEAMARHARMAASACAVLEHNHRMVAEGRLSPSVAEIGNRIARANKAQASLNHSRAQQRYRNAQKLLALNPLPGDNA